MHMCFVEVKQAVGMAQLYRQYSPSLHCQQYTLRCHHILTDFPVTVMFPL